MPEFGTPFDPTTPTDANWLHEGDDRIREIKAGLIERFLEVFENFPSGAPDGVLKLREAWLKDQLPDDAVPVQIGTLAARPNPPAKVGLLYYASDVDQLFLSLAGEPLSWKLLAPRLVLSGLAAARPSPPPRENTLFWATDEKKLWIATATGTDNELEWVEVSTAKGPGGAGGLGRHVFYSQTGMNYDDQPNISNFDIIRRITVNGTVKSGPASTAMITLENFRATHYPDDWDGYIFSHTRVNIHSVSDPTNNNEDYEGGHVLTKVNNIWNEAQDRRQVELTIKRIVLVTEPPPTRVSLFPLNSNSSVSFALEMFWRASTA